MFVFTNFKEFCCVMGNDIMSCYLHLVSYLSWLLPKNWWELTCILLSFFVSDFVIVIFVVSFG